MKHRKPQFLVLWASSPRTLIERAKTHTSLGGRRDCLTLAISRYLSKDPREIPIQSWRESCLVYETPEATKGSSARDDSLLVLRRWLAARCDAFVAIGGNWWHEVAGRAGVPIEAGLAIERGLPCFLLGGLGGAATTFVEDHPELIKSLKNGLDDDANRSIAIEHDVAGLVDRIVTQLARLPMVRGRVSDGVSFRILALDGGGIKGAFTASVLATLESDLKEPVANHFDLIAGTSTGGILAAGIGMGLTPYQMLQFYKDRGPAIFPTMRIHKEWQSKLRHFVKPKHSQEVLRHELQQAFSANSNLRKLSDSICRLVIPAYDAVSGTCHVFRTPHHDLLRSDEAASIIDVALATAAAPTYFSPAVVQNMISRGLYFDGGVWANCPAMAAIVEAVCYLGVSLDRIEVLSIGTTAEPFTVKMMKNAGVLKWGRTLIDLLMNAQVDSSLRHAELLVGEPRFLRINAMTAPGEYVLDNSAEIGNLIALGQRTASDGNILYQVKSRFLNGVSTDSWR
jgi:uncharacterized protein